MCVNVPCPSPSPQRSSSTRLHKHRADFSRVIWVVGRGGFARNWWVSFSELLGRTLGGVVLGSLKAIHTRNICPVGYRPKPLFEGG
ncbi:hypothetical protein DEO72_LG4g578 [Vigna unguiculata]|uniref:Uncharacterized protein n=1 Tax=Vigna unguiculata TaxID=3917 RepID=A0A4D6LLG9_VIGUN|nr:hypothetical protein DEO72_LG4g578 [Vigna unguiculata]